MLPLIQPSQTMVEVKNGIITMRSGALNTLMVADRMFNNVVSAMSAYNVFGSMKLTNKGMFKITSFNTPELQWMPKSKSCAFDPIRGVTTQTEQHTPCEIEHQSQLCIDDLDNDCFGQFWQYNEQGKIGVNGTFTPEVQAVLDMMAKVEANGMSASLRALFSSASQYKGFDSQIVFKKGVDADIKSRYEKSKNNCMGYPALLFDLAKIGGNHHLDQSELFTDADCNGGVYTGSVEELIMKLRKSTKTGLQNAINQGGGINTATGKKTTPVAIVSQPIYNKLIEEYEAQCHEVVTKMNCLTKEMMPVSFISGGATISDSIPIYKVHGLPVICDAYINTLDAYTNATTFFACITYSENIVIGTSFGQKGNIANEQTIGLMVEFTPNRIKDGNMMYRQANALISTAIADTNYIVAARRIEIEA